MHRGGRGVKGGWCWRWRWRRTEGVVCVRCFCYWRGFSVWWLGRSRLYYRETSSSIEI